MHRLDQGGVPGCAIASAEFQAAASAQAKALGFMPAMIWLAHPIQSRTNDELADMARDAVSQILQYIKGGNSQ